MRAVSCDDSMCMKERDREREGVIFDWEGSGINWARCVFVIVGFSEVSCGVED